MLTTKEVVLPASLHRNSVRAGNQSLLTALLVWLYWLQTIGSLKVLMRLV